MCYFQHISKLIHLNCSEPQEGRQEAVSLDAAPIHFKEDLVVWTQKLLKCSIHDIIKTFRFLFLSFAKVEYSNEIQLLRCFSKSEDLNLTDLQPSML